MSLIASVYGLLVGAHVVLVGVVMAAVLFGARGRWRLAAALAATVAVWLPLTIQVSALDQPKPNPPDKVLKLLGAVEDGRQNIYLFVDTEPGEPAPRMYTVKQVKNKHDDHQIRAIQTSYSHFLGVKVNYSESGEVDVVYMDYVMPDWDKDDMQRGYRAPPTTNSR